MDHHWAITTSSGRRVSLLCDEKPEFTHHPSYASSVASSYASPTPPPSPDYRRPYAPLRTDSISSTCSSTTSLSTVSSQGLYSPRTPPTMPLPPLEKILPVSETTYFPAKPSALAEMPIDERLSPSTSSTPSSPKSSSAAASAVKRATRRYSCHCGKSFTTSGHLARHTRIHTGEKNYVCPEEGCGARFSRQDNCMQHFRTHQSGSGSKRTSRKRRASNIGHTQQPPVAQRIIEPTVAPTPKAPVNHHHQHQQSPNVYYPPVYAVVDHNAPPPQYPPYGGEAGLAALASVACSTYT
ncbi:hypothetical protein EX30DRAFT_344548 [Ascodesmis nigricans]|uniref:C2H2 type master regulator of conidiophore development brlA n=1 Tax=Ascodesmis nigricans TaxID=341454 RepID=A0A4S2MJC8_9PEZI|nr:hypothetical protein EX30DRAFT_344548 [Ascodesmis nigricans]